MRVVAFAFFLVFLAGIALVNLKRMEGGRATFAADDTALVSALAAQPWRLAPGSGEDTLSFDAGGTLSGYTGCNRYSGRYTLDHGKLAIETLRMTRKACAGERMTAESTYVHYLQQAGRVDVADDTLTLRTGGGTVLARFQPASGTAN